MPDQSGQRPLPARPPGVPTGPSPQPPGRFPPPPPGPPPRQQPTPPRRLPGFDPGALVGRVRHGEPALRRIARSAGRALGTTREPRELAELAAAAQRAVTTGRRIAVTSVRGGAGKSAVTALLGLVFAARRGDPVLVVDADPEPGSLSWLLGLPTPAPMHVLGPRLMSMRGADLRSLGAVLPRTPGGLWLLPGGSAGRPDLARDLTRALGRLFAVCVTDCGLVMSSAAAVSVLSEAHVVVVVTPATPDGVRATCAALDQATAANPASLARMVIALNRLGRSALREDAALAAFAPYRLPVVVLPHDRHVASGAPIDPARIAEPTVVAVTRLAAQALDRALAAQGLDRAVPL